jgi:hypothetical protein
MQEQASDLTFTLDGSPTADESEALTSYNSETYF